MLLTCTITGMPSKDVPIEIDKGQDNTTRLALVSAILGGSSFRLGVINQATTPFRAVAPEIGLNMDLVTRFCRQMEGRESLYQIVQSLVVFAVAGALLYDEVHAAVFLALLSLVVHFFKIHGERYYFLPKLWPENFTALNFDREVMTQLTDGEKAALSVPAQNVVVYSGFNPFVGAGVRLGGWSVTVDLTQTTNKTHSTALPLFRVTELLGAVDIAVHKLDFRNAEVRDIIFVNGSTTTQDAIIHPDRFARPRQCVDPETTSRYIDRWARSVRTYKCIRIYDRSSDLVLSFFLRAAVNGGVLFVELSRHILGTPRKHYYTADGAPRGGLYAHVGFVKSTLLGWPLAVVLSPVFVWWKAARNEKWLANRERREWLEVYANPLYDYGAKRSLRERMASNQYTEYFDGMDADFYVRAVEKTALDAIAEFLEGHGVDVADLRHRERLILNQDVMIQVKAQDAAVGSGSRVAGKPWWEEAIRLVWTMRRRD